jgi:hypothetical protein
MAVLALQTIISSTNKAMQWNKYKKALLFTGSLLVMLLLFYVYASYTTAEDNRLLSQAKAAPEAVKTYILQFIAALKEDRKGLFAGSLTRSFLFIAAAALLLFLFIKDKIKAAIAIAGIGCLAFIDVMAIDLQYLNTDNYLDQADYQQANFSPSPADKQIMQDKSYYRVLDIRDGVHDAFNTSALSGYFHYSVGGYHPAKLSIYQDLIEHQLYNYPNCTAAINMLNTKYIIDKDSTGRDTVIINKDALGPAWFVPSVRFEDMPEAVMHALDSINPRNTAVVFAKDKDLVNYSTSPNNADSITLVENKNDAVLYVSNATAPRFAVFSEIFYQQGWKAFIDNKEVPIVRTNYVLRGLSVPAGRHNIRFIFHPASYYTGRKIAQVMGIVVLLLLVAVVYRSYRTH